MSKYLDGVGLSTLCEKINTNFLRSNVFSLVRDFTTTAGTNTLTLPSDFLSQDQYSSMAVYLDGIKLVRDTDFTFNSTTRVLTFVDTFISGDIVTVGLYTSNYEPATEDNLPAQATGVLTSDGTSMSWKNFNKLVYKHDTTSANETVTVPVANLTDALVTEVYRNGLRLLDSDDYTINTSTGEITFTQPIVANEKIVVITQKAITPSGTLISGVTLQNSTATTPSAGDSSTSIATTAYVQNNLNNYVDLISSQTISGSKNFTDYHLSTVLGDNSSETQYAGYELLDKDNHRLGTFRGKHYSNGTRTVQMYACGLNSEICSLECNVNSSGTVYTSAPTPQVGNNSTQIATTAFVKTALDNRFANPIEKVNAITSAASITIDPNAGSLFTLSLSTNASITIGNISNGPYTTNGETITLYLNNTNNTITWNSKITWISGEAPDVTSNPSIITFVTFNGGTNWYGSSIEVESSS